MKIEIIQEATMISFDAKNHEYKHQGKRVPSVTQILADCKLIDLSMVPERFLHAACEFGGVVHSATEYFDKGELDYNSISDEVNAYIDAWDLFIKQFSVQIIEIEMRVHSKKYGFAGTLDRVAIVNGKISILDIKSGSPQKAYACQTAAYALAYREMTGEKKLDRYCVFLDEKKYRLKKHEDKLDENMFLTALSLYNYKRR